jgi:5-methylcytosine-specific restriction endonuclease McrA
MVKKRSKNSKLTSLYKKKKIPKKVKEEVWYSNFGKIYEKKCYISWCSNKINVFNFHVGHDIPESKGGTDEINNLKPICDRCNLSMGNNYTIKEWNIKFNKNMNKSNNNITNIKNNIRYYNSYKYISIVIFIYLFFNNYYYLDYIEKININNNEILKNCNNILNNIITNISNYIIIKSYMT